MATPERPEDQAQPDNDPPHRRQEDTAVPEKPEESGRRSAREVLQRLRQPIIGLGLAGAAIPMVNAAQPADQTAPSQPEHTPTAPAEELAAARAAGDTEENLVERIAESREQTERDEHVTAAVDKYGIDRALAEDIYDIAREENIEPRVAYGLVKTESTFDERAVSHVGARGLTQVMPRTAKWLVPGTKTEDLYNRETNLRLGFSYLDQLISKYKGNVRLALLAYNRGPGTVDKVLKRGGDPNNGYADKVLKG